MNNLGHNSQMTASPKRVIVLPEANSGLPRREDFERMARRRFQDPKPKRKGAWWWILSYKDEFVDGKIARKRKRLKVAPATMGEREAKKIASEMLRPMNQGLESIGSATQFGAYIETTYRDTVLPLLASSVQKTYTLTLKKHLLPLFANMPLRDMNVITLQKYFSGMKANHPTALKIKDVLSSALGSAARFGLLVRSPMSGVQLMAPKHGKRVKPHITPEQFDALVNLMVEPYATMVYVCVMAGLRVSELIGLKWEDVHMDSLTIDERYCRGDWAAPKTAASSATIGVSLKVIQRIQQLKNTSVIFNWGRGAKKTIKLVRSDAPGDLVFQSVRAGVPMSDHNILSRHIKPAGEKLGIRWVNWQVFRRSYATWLVEAGADPKAVQGQMRHSRIGPTMDIYAQFVPESQRRAVAQMAEMVEGRTVKSAGVVQ